MMNANQNPNYYGGAPAQTVFTPQGNGYYTQPGGTTPPWDPNMYQAPYAGAVANQNVYNVRNGQITGINYLTDDELKSLEQKKHEVWSISKEQAARSKCTHKNPKTGLLDGYFKQGENLWHCNICNQDFHFVEVPQKDIEATTNFLLDVMDTTKFMWLAPPKDVVEQFYPVMDWIAKIPDAYRLAKQQWDSKNQISKLYTAGSMYTPPAYGTQAYGTTPGPISSDYAPTGVPIMAPYQGYQAYQPPYQGPQYGQQYGQQTYQNQYGQQYGGYQPPQAPNPLVQAQPQVQAYPPYQSYQAPAAQMPGATATPPVAPSNPYGIPPETAAQAPAQTTTPVAQAAPAQPAQQTPPTNAGLYVPNATGTPDVSNMTTTTTAQTI